MKSICLINEKENFSKEAISSLEKRFRVSEITNIAEDEYACVEVIYVRLRHYINEEFLKPFPNVKIICSPTTGLTHIDTVYCLQKNIEIICLKGQKTFLASKITATPEFTWGLFICGWRKILLAYQDVLRGQWARDNFKSEQLAGKTVGIIGMGRVGQRIRKYALAFDMVVTYFDPNVDSIDGKEKNLADLIGKNVILFICCSYDHSNHHLLQGSLLQEVLPNTMIVNTARGELINTPELIEVLRQKNITYLADVIEDEHLIFEENHIIKTLLSPELQENVVITPHIAGACLDAMKLTEEFVTKLLMEKLC